MIAGSNTAGSTYALKNSGGSSGGTGMGSSSVTVSSADIDNDGRVDLYISEPASDIVWKTTAKSGGFDLTNGSDYLDSKSGSVKIFSTQQNPTRYWTYSAQQLKHNGGYITYFVQYGNNSFSSGYGSTDKVVYVYEKTAVGNIPTEAPTEAPTTAPTSAPTERPTTAPGTGSEVNIGVTSDVHGNMTGLRSWITAVQGLYDPGLDAMLYCGDYSYEFTNLNAYIEDFYEIVNITDELVGNGKGIYTTGNHEYYSNNKVIPLNAAFTETPGFVRIGEAKRTANYIVYCFGAADWYNGVGSYPEEDIAALDAYLSTAPKDIPIFIPAHYPLHRIYNRTITNADKVINVLNKYPNAVFLWGHNHSQGDNHYGQIITSGGTIEYASYKTSKINFTYACAGGMVSESHTKYSGMVATVSADGKTVDFKYYQTSTGAQIGNTTTIRFE